MKFELSLFPPRLVIEMPAVEQVGTIDLVTAVLGALQGGEMPIMCVHEDEAEDRD